ncbi:hypothetical protein QCA50_003645 [Cerrena zonata]|uniref:F-box domain-containing protein n=1 Tax=Cerrena zonata TaxID=2478898 RepID=A0AAW0GSR6_9APHY
MITLADEGFNECDAANTRNAHDLLLSVKSIREREDLVYALLNSLPKSSLASIQRNIEPMLQLDVVGLLPDEVALLVYSYLPWQSLLTCALVNRRWRTLANDPTLWRTLCAERDWQWRQQHKPRDSYTPSLDLSIDLDDEGMGDDEEEDVEHMLEDSGFASMAMDSSPPVHCSDLPSSPSTSSYNYRNSGSSHYNYPNTSYATITPTHFSKPDYKLLYLTHIRLQNRMRSTSYRLYSLNTHGSTNPHTNTIYCLQLYTYPDTGKQVLFTGSKDRTVREWDLTTNSVCRVIEGVHEGSVLSICVYNGLLASGGSDQTVAIWDLARNELVRVIQDHADSVLCVRFDDTRLVTCSKDRTVRSYSLPDFKLQYVIDDHRAAVNAVSISQDHIVSASGDRSMKLWNAKNGSLVSTFESHHGRGIASIDFKPPYILSGSSDKHLRLIDMTTCQGWSTSPDFDPQTSSGNADTICETCGNVTSAATIAGPSNANGVAAAAAAVAFGTNAGAANGVAGVNGGNLGNLGGGNVNGGMGGLGGVFVHPQNGVRYRPRAHGDLVRSVALNA